MKKSKLENLETELHVPDKKTYQGESYNAKSFSWGNSRIGEIYMPDTVKAVASGSLGGKEDEKL